MSHISGPTSKISMYDGSYGFFSLDPTILDGKICHALSDPTYLTFRVFFGLDGHTGLFGNYDANVPESRNSALAFFKRIGDNYRYQLLTDVIAMLRTVQNNASHCFDSITGLDDAWKRSVSDVLVKDKTIGLKLVESVDWRFTRAISMLREVLYDYSRMVYVLPINLRSFNLYVYVTEVRVFDETITMNNGLATYDDMNEQIFGISAKTFGPTPFHVENSSANRAEMFTKRGKDKRIVQRINETQISGLTSTTAENRDMVSNSNTSEHIQKYITDGAHVMFCFGNCVFNTDSGIFSEMCC